MKIEMSFNCDADFLAYVEGFLQMLRGNAEKLEEDSGSNHGLSNSLFLLSFMISSYMESLTRAE